MKALGSPEAIGPFPPARSPQYLNGRRASAPWSTTCDHMAATGGSAPRGPLAYPTWAGYPSRGASW
eukprot:13660615-Alexandrium_andersonii.AAC.1